MRARRATGILAAAAAICIGVGVPMLVHAGIVFNATLSKTHAGNFTVGSNGTYTLDISMASGTVQSDTFSVTDTLPNGLSYVTAGGPSFTCSNSGQVVHCSGGPATFSQGSSETMTVVVGVGSAASPAVTNTASFTDSFSGDNTTSDNTAVDTASVAAASTSATTTTTTTSTTTTSTGAPAAVAAPSVGAGSGGVGIGTGLVVAGLVALVAAVVVRRRR